jgi:predicted nucleotidyltransferase
MSKDLRFYELMNYPVPHNSTLYTYIDTTTKQVTHWEHKEFEKTFSWSKKCDSMDEYIDYIDTRSQIFKYIPCIRQVYLCNSITFNALHDNSDIDLCIITRRGYIRFARLFSWLAIHILWLQRDTWKFNNNAKKICLSFYIDEWYTDIYHIRNTQWDIYLSYRLAHSVLLYSDTTLDDDYLYTNNTRLLSYLPHHSLQQSIYIGNKIIKENTHIKKRIEYILCNPVGSIVHRIIWQIRGKYIIAYKKSWLSPHTKKNIIVSSAMLKFHQDKRDIIQHKVKIFMTNIL